MTQGYEANHSGKFLEDILHRELAARGFLFRDYGEDADNLDMFAARIVVRNVPYHSLFDCESRSEFVITDGTRKIRVECRWQSTSGSVDEKFPYLLKNMEKCAPEREALILYGGEGARPGAINYLKCEARKITAKTIHVVSIGEFPSWVRRELVAKRVAA